MVQSRSILWAIAASALFFAGCGPEDLRGENVGAIEEPLVVCPSGPTVEGVDVSYYQGNIDWDAVWGSGRDFAVARVNDGNFMDPQFDTYWSGMKAAGLIRGAYQFFRPAMSRESLRRSCW